MDKVPDKVPGWMGFKVKPEHHERWFKIFFADFHPELFPEEIQAKELKNLILDKEFRLSEITMANVNKYFENRYKDPILEKKFRDIAINELIADLIRFKNNR